MITINLPFRPQPNETDPITANGETVSRVEIVTAKTPFGTIWIGATLFTNSMGSAMKLQYTIRLNKEIIAPLQPSQDEAIAFANKWYTERALVVTQQVQDEILKFQTEQVAKAKASKAKEDESMKKSDDSSHESDEEKMQDKENTAPIDQTQPVSAPSVVQAGTTTPPSQSI